MKEKLFTVFEVFFLFCFGILFVSFFVYNIGYNSATNPWLSLLAGMIIMVVWFFMHRLIKKHFNRINKRAEIAIVAGVVLVFMGIQIFLAVQTVVDPSWDFGSVFKNASNLALRGNRLTPLEFPAYFQNYPNNIMLFWADTVAIFIGNIFHISALKSVIIMNILFIDLAIIFLYLCARKLFSRESAFFTLCLAFFFTPLLTYSPIVYSDTMSLVFPLLLIYIYLYTKDIKETGWKKYIIWVLIAVIAFIGSEFKITVLITLIAILADIWRKFDIKKFCTITAIVAVCFIGFKFSYKALIGDYFTYDSYGQVPYTHWIMMGIDNPDSKIKKGVPGGYSEEDLIQTMSFETGKEAIPYNLVEIKRRLVSYGAVDYSQFLLKKAVYVWGDGTYFAPNKLGRSPKKSLNNISHQWLLSGGKYFPYYLTFAQGVQYAFILIMMIGTYLAIRSKDRKVTFLRLSVWGVFIFLLFWESRSRYITNFIPIFILLVTYSYCKIDECLLKRTTQNTKND